MPGIHIKLHKATSPWSFLIIFIENIMAFLKTFCHLQSQDQRFQSFYNLGE